MLSSKPHDEELYKITISDELKNIEWIEKHKNKLLSLLGSIDYKLDSVETFKHPCMGEDDISISFHFKNQKITRN